ncbi:MAG: tRNA 2-thiouridine(34) synthase MnmA [Gammaproteobacteria bacterium]|jgi:tRNA-specific 2-thiouridylase
MKIIVGISGGVDSSVTALLLKQQGYEVEALFMKNWNEESEKSGCSWESDVEDALHVCEKLNIPLNTIDLSDEYWTSVFSLMLKDFKNGLTPNPDILCNQEIKFKAFMEHALNLGADKIATGHYANIFYDHNTYQLLKGDDKSKDQSYFLCKLTQQQLSRTLFPIGNLNKTEVRKIAKDFELVTHDKKDSTGICFIGERPFKEFLSRYIPTKTGSIKSISGEVMGVHDGVYFYTIGQRQGLGIGGVKGTSNEPWYVYDKDYDLNILYVTQGKDNKILYKNNIVAEDIHWINAPPVEMPHSCSAKIRYRQEDQACTIQSIHENSTLVSFQTPQKAVTPGQYIVFYNENVCLGGGTIISSSI